MTQPVIVILWIVFAGSLLAILAVYRRIRQGARDLDTLERILSLPDQPWDTVQNAKLASLVIRERIVRLSALFEQMERPDILLLREESDAQFDNHFGNRFLQFSASSLLIIGLCGTFIASRSILTHSGLDTVFSGDTIDMQRFRASIDAIYSGFEHAFAASILGISFTIVVSACMIGVQKYWKGFLERFDRLTTTVILPRYSRRDRSESGELRDAAASIQAASTRLGTAVGDIAGKGQDFAGNMDATVQRMADAAEVLETVTAEESPLVQTLAAIALLQKKFMDERDRLDGQLANLIAQIQTLVGTVAASQGEFVRLNGALAGLHDAFPAKIEAITTAYRDSIERLVERSIDFIRTESGKIDTQRSAALTLLQGTQALLARIQSGQDAAESRLTPSIQKLEQTVGDLDGAVQRIPAEIRTAVSQITFPPISIPPVSVPPITVPPVQLPDQALSDLRRVSGSADRLADAAGKLERASERLERVSHELRSGGVIPSTAKRGGVVGRLFARMIGRDSR